MRGDNDGDREEMLDSDDEDSEFCVGKVLCWKSCSVLCVWFVCVCLFCYSMKTVINYASRTMSLPIIFLIF